MEISMQDISQSVNQNKTKNCVSNLLKLCNTYFFQINQSCTDCNVMPHMPGE